MKILVKQYSRFDYFSFDKYSDGAYNTCMANKVFSGTVNAVASPAVFAAPIFMILRKEETMGVTKARVMKFEGIYQVETYYDGRFSGKSERFSTLAEAELWRNEWYARLDLNEAEAIAEV